MSIEAAAEAVEREAKKYPRQPIGMPSGSIGWGATPTDVAKAAIAAFAGDRALYREATPSEWVAGKAHSQDMPVVQVWPEPAE